MSFTDDRDGCLFTVTMYRKAIEGSVEPESSSDKGSEKILALLKADPELPAREIADTLGITQMAVEKQVMDELIGPEASAIVMTSVQGDPPEWKQHVRDKDAEEKQHVRDKDAEEKLLDRFRRSTSTRRPCRGSSPISTNCARRCPCRYSSAWPSLPAWTAPWAATRG